MQINNNTKIKIKVGIDIALPTLRLPPCFHLEANSFWFDTSKSESTSFFLEILDW